MPHDFLTTIGGRLSLIRGRRSQAAFAREIGVHKNTLGNYERGERTPDAEFLFKLVKAGFSVHWVLTGEGPMMLADLAPPGAPSPALDRELLKLIVEAVDSGLEAMDLEMGSAKKAELILAIYDFYRDSGLQPDTAKILNFVRSAA